MTEEKKIEDDNNETKNESNEAEDQKDETIEEEQFELPPVSFENLILNFYNLAMMSFGVRDPESGKIIRNLPMAKHNIDTLGMLQEKTKGNLSVPESNLLENLLYDLRMNYLRALKQDNQE